MKIDQQERGLFLRIAKNSGKLRKRPRIKKNNSDMKCMKPLY